MKHAFRSATRACAVALVFALIGLFPSAVPAGTELLGRVVVLGERESDTPQPVVDVAVAIEGVGETRTNQRGGFLLTLPFAPGILVTAEIDHPGHVIYRPYRGEFRLPAPVVGRPAKSIAIMLLPRGSHRLMDDYTFKRYAEQLKRDAQDELRPDDRPEVIDFTGYLRELGRRLGFSLEDVERGLTDWQTRKQANPDTDPYELGLVAVTQQEFDEARRLFRQSRLLNESALLDDERNLAKLQQRITERRRLIIRDLRAEANAAYLAYDFADALKLFQQAMDRTDLAADPESWTESSMAVANSHFQLGTRVGGGTQRSGTSPRRWLPTGMPCGSEPASSSRSNGRAPRTTWAPPCATRARAPAARRAGACWPRPKRHF